MLVRLSVCVVCVCVVCVCVCLGGSWRVCGVAGEGFAVCVFFFGCFI